MPKLNSGLPPVGPNVSRLPKLTRLLVCLLVPNPYQDSSFSISNHSQLHPLKRRCSGGRGRKEKLYESSVTEKLKH